MVVCDLTKDCQQFRSVDHIDFTPFRIAVAENDKWHARVPEYGENEPGKFEHSNLLLDENKLTLSRFLTFPFWLKSGELSKLSKSKLYKFRKAG